MTKNEPQTTTDDFRAKQIACFDLCQNIGLSLVERGQNISLGGVMFHAFHSQIIKDLESTKAFIERAIETVKRAEEII